MTLEQAIIILEDSAARREMCHEAIPAKTKAGRLENSIRDDECRRLLARLKELKEQEFPEHTPEYVAKYGNYWKLQ